MKQKLKVRLKELQGEYQKGQERLAQLEEEIMNTKTAMLRISGAIQVLEELLAEEGQKIEKQIVPENGEKTNAE